MSNVAKKIKVSYHSGKGYAKHLNHYSTKRDKGNIDHELTPKNRLWTCYKGVTDAVEAEKRLYEKVFTKELEQQNKKYRKKGNYDRIRSIDDWRKAERHRPTENILQIGNMHCYIDPEDLWECYTKFIQWRKSVFGDHIILISAAMHRDESTPHIHERYVWYWTDDNGIKHTGVKKSLEQAGVELPDPNQKESRENYRKATFDAMCREKWQDIVEEKLMEYSDLVLDRSIDQERKENKIGHMGVDAWREFDRAFERMRKKCVALDRRKDELAEKEEELQKQREAYENDKAALEAEMQQHKIDVAYYNDAKKELKRRETELAAQERGFNQKVEDTVQRRLDADKKITQMLVDHTRSYTAGQENTL